MIEDLQSMVDRLQKEKQDILNIKKVVKETSVSPVPKKEESIEDSMTASFGGTRT